MSVRPRHPQGSADTYAVEDAVTVISAGTVCPRRFRLAGGTGRYRTARMGPLPSGISLNVSKNMEVCVHG